MRRGNDREPNGGSLEVHHSLGNKAQCIETERILDKRSAQPVETKTPRSMQRPGIAALQQRDDWNESGSHASSVYGAIWAC